MPKQILVTGGAGFIGCELSHALVAAGHDVTVMDVLHPQVHTGRGLPDRLPPSVQFLSGDVVHAPDWDAVLRIVRPEVVVHLAAETGTGQSLREATRHGSVNVVGTTSMLDALVRAEHVPEHLVLASSRAVYGEGAWACGDEIFYPGPRSHDQLEAAEWDPRGPDGSVAVPLPHAAQRVEPRPSNVYAATKLAQEHVLRAWCAALGSSLSILRLQNVYGPGQAIANSYTGVLTFFARVASGGGTIDVFEDGEIVRDFVFVSDVVAALGAALAAPPVSGERVVDIGSGHRATIGEVARVVAALTGAPDPVVSGNFRDGDVRAAWADISSASDDLGYRPAVRLEEGVAALVEWVREELPTLD